MSNIDKILEYVQKTNPDMTMDKLMEEMSRCRYSTIALAIVCKNDKKYSATA